MYNKNVRKDLVEAWECYVNNSYTFDDVALILDSIKDKDESFHQEFTEVFNRVVWNEAINELPPTSEEQELYRKKAAQLLAKYQSGQQKQPLHVSLRNIIYRFRKIWYAAAAALLLGMLIPAIYLYMKPKAEQTVQYIEEVTGRGEIRTVILPDLSEVTLNVGSHIKYPVNFTTDERSVELYGEALFSVASYPGRPFIVKTENMNIRVLGTVFDVKGYANDLFSSVSVASGKVEIDLANDKIVLEQNQQLKIDNVTGEFEKKNTDANKCLSWTTGTLYFHRTPIREVVNILNRHFPQMEIELAEDEYPYLITGEYDNKISPEDILKSIFFITDLKYRKTGNKYILFSN